MKLMTKTIEKELLASDVSSNHSFNDRVIVKYFNPYGIGTWLVVAGERLERGDWNLYGYHNSGNWEWGYVRLSELEAITVPLFNGKIERDLFHTGTVAELSR